MIDYTNKNHRTKGYRQNKPMKADSENEFVYGIVFVVGFIVLFGIYSVKRDQINSFFNSEKSFVENIFDDSYDEKQRRANKERQRQKYIDSQERSNIKDASGSSDKDDNNSDGYDRIIFDNKSGGARKVYWVSKSGSKSLYKTLEPGESYEQRAYSHHKWIVANEKGDDLGVFFSKGDKSYVIMYDDHTKNSLYKNESEKVSKPNLIIEEAKISKNETKERRSLNSNQPTTIRFVNYSKDLIKIYWLDFKGNKVLYKKLNPNQEYKQVTFITHPWLVTDKSEKEIGIYYPEKTLKRVEVK